MSQVEGHSQKSFCNCHSFEAQIVDLDPLEIVDYNHLLIICKSELLNIEFISNLCASYNFPTWMLDNFEQSLRIQSHNAPHLLHNK